VIVPGSGGVGYYRAVQPATYLNRFFRREVVAIVVEGVTPELVYGWADVIVLSRMSHPEFYMFTKRTNAAVVYEIDDLIHDIDEGNPVSRDWNKESYRYWWSKEIMGACPYLQTSTEGLLRHYGAGKVKAVVLPNMIDPDLFPPVAPNESATVRIGWQGSHTHYKDLLVVRDALYRIQKEYGDRVKFYFVGWSGKYESPVSGDKVDALKGLERRTYGWHNIYDGSYYAFLASLGLNIAIAPLEDTPFNQCKSNIKTLEYGACGYAVVASSVGPYRWINKGCNGLSVGDEDWYTALKLLIEDKGLRETYGANLRKDVLANYDIKKRIHEYYDFYASLKEKR